MAKPTGTGTRAIRGSATRDERNGRAQARRHGDVLKPLMPALADFDFVSSPLGRADRDDQIVRPALGLDAERYPLGSATLSTELWPLGGPARGRAVPVRPCGLAQKASDPFGWRPSHGESYRDLQQRVRLGSPRLRRIPIAVTHGGVSRVRAGRLFGHRTEHGALPGRAPGQGLEVSRRDDVVALIDWPNLLDSNAKIKRAGEAAPRLFVTHSGA